MTPKRATVNHWGRAMNHPRKGQEVVIMSEMRAVWPFSTWQGASCHRSPQDHLWGVRKGDPWALVAWVETQIGVVPAENYISSCWIPAQWLDEHGEVA